MKTALVLGGGGARGMAHVGVLQTLEKAGIPIDMIVGCSFGAIVGGMYAQHPDANQLSRRLFQFLETDTFEELGLHYIRKRPFFSDDYLQQLIRNVKDWFLLNLFFSRSSFLKSIRLQNVIKALIEPGKFQDTKIPFACNATDLVSGQSIIFNSGDIRPAITASASIPGYFPPVIDGTKKLVDGGITYNLPIKFARALGATFVIAVDIHPQLQVETDVENVLDIILRANTISLNTLSLETREGADILISPPVNEYFWYEFDRSKEIARAGADATQQALKHIRREHPQLRKQRLRKLVSVA